MSYDAERAAQGQVPLVVVIGKRGTGKTRWMRDYISRHVTQTDFLVCDPEAQYRAEDFHGRATNVSASRFQWVKRTAPGWVYLFRDADGETVARIALHMGHCAVVLDEADADYGKQGHWIDKESALWKLVNRGRQHFVGAYVLFRRPVDVSRTSTANASAAVICYVQEQRDLQWIEENWGKDAATLVRRLPPPSAKSVTVVMLNLNGPHKPTLHTVW